MVCRTNPQNSRKEAHRRANHSRSSLSFPMASSWITQNPFKCPTSLDIRSVVLFEIPWNFKGYLGKGVRIAIVDDGIQTTHPDVQPNIRIDSCWNFNKGVQSPDPTYMKGSGGVCLLTSPPLILVGLAWNSICRRSCRPEWWSLLWYRSRPTCRISWNRNSPKQCRSNFRSTTPGDTVRCPKFLQLCQKLILIHRLVMQ